MQRSSKSWIAVASADHVAIGREQGFAQVNHGKAAPLRRMQPGDRIIYYAPVRTFRAGDVCSPSWHMDGSPRERSIRG